MVTIKLVDEWREGDKEIEWKSTQFIENWVRELEKALPKSFEIILNPTVYKGGIKVGAPPFPLLSETGGLVETRQYYRVNVSVTAKERKPENGLTVQGLSWYNSSDDKTEENLFTEVNSVQEVVKAIVSDIEKKMLGYIEKLKQ